MRPVIFSRPATLPYQGAPAGRIVAAGALTTQVWPVAQGLESQRQRRAARWCCENSYGWNKGAAPLRCNAPNVCSRKAQPFGGGPPRRAGPAPALSFNSYNTSEFPLCTNSTRWAPWAATGPAGSAADQRNQAGDVSTARCQLRAERGAGHSGRIGRASGTNTISFVPATGVPPMIAGSVLSAAGGGDYPGWGRLRDLHRHRQQPAAGAAGAVLRLPYVVWAERARKAVIFYRHLPLLHFLTYAFEILPPLCFPCPGFAAGRYRLPAIHANR